ncbi:nitroreductase [Noviherbaspirillum sp. Root189]|uniref:nitroreductase n=1 Tax=Noviherbaspirillum sp. Root189 TaxID=1736487 RepID=UPI00070A0665|nr:nitroreductase [Noviherbaspirillum sp. Root189]KRB84060.1 NADH dehydrogenase [Noviherbaspirillum sp. Root189]
MKVSEAIQTRRSIRGFLDTPVPRETMRRILETASRAPSGGNLQPWHIHVVSGEPLAELKHIMQQRITEAPQGEETEYDIYPRELVSPYRERRYQVGEDLYGHLGIPREDKAARKKWFARNFAFFGAPMALFCTVDRRMGPPQWSDLGMFLQNVMLLLREEGLHSCPQECWAIYPQTVGSFLNIPPERILFTGMAIGHADWSVPANALVAERAPLEHIAEFIG